MKRLVPSVNGVGIQFYTVIETDRAHRGQDNKAKTSGKFNFFSLKIPHFLPDISHIEEYFTNK